MKIVIEFGMESESSKIMRMPQNLDKIFSLRIFGGIIKWFCSNPNSKILLKNENKIFESLDLIENSIEEPRADDKT